MLSQPPGSVLPVQPVTMAMHPLLPPGVWQTYYQHGDAHGYGHSHVQKWRNGWLLLAVESAGDGLASREGHAPGANMGRPITAF